MQINRQVLQQRLELLQKCSSASVNEDISDKIIFHNKGIINISRGRLITMLDGDYDFEGVFPIDNFLKIIKAMSGEDVNAEMIDDELKLSSNKSKLGLRSLPIENFMTKYVEKALDYVFEKEFKPLPKNFLQGLNAVFQCTPKDKTTPMLSFVAVLSNHLTASDNLRIGDFKLSKKFSTNFLIDDYNVQSILDFNPTSYHLNENQIIFTRDNDYQVCAIIDGKYPDFSVIIKRKPDMIITLPDELKESVYLAQQIPGKSNDRNMQMSLSKNKIALSCNTVSGWFKKNLRIDYSGDPITFSMNLNVLYDILNNVGNEIHVSNEGTGIIHTENFNYCFPIEIEDI